MIELIIATRNAHKVAEISAILGAPCRGLRDFPGAPVTVEDAPTFAGNATKKAVELGHWLSSSLAPRPSPLSPLTSTAWVLADDSGLEVDALQGAPGVWSARFAAAAGSQPAGNSPDAANNARLLELLAGVPAGKRTARFRCVLALAPVPAETAAGASPVCYAEEAELRTELFEGVCEGAIEFAPRGSGGFGYDPLFVPAGYRQTFAELGAETKNQLSHRARALAGLHHRLKSL